MVEHHSSALSVKNHDFGAHWQAAQSHANVLWSQGKGVLPFIDCHILKFVL